LLGFKAGEVPSTAPEVGMEGNPDVFDQKAATARNSPFRVLRAAVVAFALTVLVTAVPAGSQLSEASWTDSDFATGTFSAAVIQPPLIDTCVLTPGALGLNPVVTITWRFPAGSGYSTPSNVSYAVASGGIGNVVTVLLPGANLTTTGPSSGVYTTQFKSGALTGLLGGSYGIFVQSVDGSSWVSPRASATASMGLAGANPQCVITPV